MALTGKVAIVTGGATGLGAAVCRGLAQRGALIVVNYRTNAAQSEETAKACRALGADAITVQGDVSQDADCVRMVAAAIDKWGRVDLLVNSAGRTRAVPQSDLAGLREQDFIDSYHTNVIGAFLMVRACEAPMRAQGFGAVVNISSLAGLTGTGSSMAYAASKGALNTLTKSLARTLAPVIRVNAICPGFMDTGWFDKCVDAAAFDQIVAGQRAQTPLGRIGHADDVARSVLFLLDEGADHITGVTLPVDAGAHLGPREANRANFEDGRMRLL